MAEKKSAKPRAVRASANSQKRVEPPTQAPLAGHAEPAHRAIVGIGASAGGLEALLELLEHLPPDTGLSFVVVTHQQVGHASLLPELLGKATAMSVTEATDNIALEANHVYLSPPGGRLAIRNARLHVTDTTGGQRPNLPIDFFFQSLAVDQRQHAICIILSGTGSDGTLGLKAIKELGGVVMIQQPQSAKYSGMPQSAIATGLADFILPLAALPRQIVATAQGNRRPAVTVPEGPPSADLTDSLPKIFTLLQAHTGHDFSAYKLNTVRRRVERQMQIHQLQRPADYLRFLQDTPAELDTLFNELLINVTRFFRDPEAFESLAKNWLPEHLASLSEHSVLRVWVPGCASGEEVYSLAITLLEYMEQSARRFGVQIFGTDLDADAIETARRGSYSDAIATTMSAARLARYFTFDDGGYRISKDVRRLAVFAPQSLIRDPPFTRLDLISCRNVLIYMNTELQQKLLATFSYALKPGGLLMLGTSETLGASEAAFDSIDKRLKLFRRKAGPLAALPQISRTTHTPAPRGSLATMANKESRILTLIERLLLSRYCPTSIVFNERGDIIHLHGRSGALLEPAEGRPRMNVLEMARDGLKRSLAHAVRQVLADGKEVVCENLVIKAHGNSSHHGHSTHVDLTVSRIEDPEPIRGLLIASFRDASAHVAPPGERRGARRGKTSNDYVDALERELQSATESLQNTVEELETANEELISVNEEAQSTNEEMQSSNEELETSQEELQSLNEELHAVNAELRLKVDQLSQASDDMQNLLDSTDIATVFLDRNLRIKRYTETTKLLVNLIAGDIGRPIGDLTTKLKYPALTADCLEVLKTLVPKVTEVETTEGAAYLVRLLPYRTMDHAIDGLVLTFDNIDELKKAQRIAATSSAYSESVVNTVRELLLVIDHELRVVRANTRFYRMFKLEPSQVEGQLIYRLADAAWDIPRLRALLNNILPDQEGFEDYALEHDFPRLGLKRFLLNARRLKREDGLPGMILLAMEDVTHRVSADTAAS